VAHADLPSNSIAARRDVRDTRVGRILNDFLDRRAGGEPVSETALLAQHPDLAGELRECLELVHDLQPPADRIAGLIAQGMLSKAADPRYLAEVGPYKITGFIGRGGMGVVLRAYEGSLDRTVALKILRPELADDAGALTRFEREAKAAAALRHPNIVTVYAIGAERGHPYITMEYIDGLSLADVIAKRARGHGADGPSEEAMGGTGVPPVVSVKGHGSQSHRLEAGATLTTELVRSIFGQLLSALAVAHDAGLIHRDVKPSNILLDGWESGKVGKWEGSASARGDEPCHVHTFPRSDAAGGVPPTCVKLADFGLARMLTAQTRMTMRHAVLGTPEYMSPEQARGDAEIDHRTDLYSAGVVLYEMLTGRTPFHGDTPTATIHQILHDAPPDPRKLDKTIDPILSSLALRLMAKHPKDRFASAAKAITALGAGDQVRSVARRRRLRFRLAFALCTSTLVASVGWALFQLARDAAKQTPAAPAVSTISAAKVKVEEDGSKTVRTKHGDKWRDFPTKPESLMTAALVDTEGDGPSVVVMGLRSSLKAPNLVAFDLTGDEVWSLNLADGRQWPDCDPPMEWHCNCVDVGNLDGEPGEEVVVGAGDTNQYPARISTVDPRSVTVLSTFWHAGGIAGLRILRDFFGPGHSGILAWGVGNKLDGPGDLVPRDYAGRRYTDYDKVSVVMILNPKRMEGLGPVAEGSMMGIAAASPHAYAFLDLSVDQSIYAPRGEDELITPLASHCARIHALAAESVLWRPQDVDAWLKFGVVRSAPDRPGTGGLLVLDRNLRLRSFLRNGGERIGMSEDYWRERWHVIVRDGKYLD
jgi:serine/threonine protein kinase